MIGFCAQLWIAFNYMQPDMLLVFVPTSLLFLKSFMFDANIYNHPFTSQVPKQ